MYYLLGLFILRGGGEGEHGVEEAAGLDELRCKVPEHRHVLLYAAVKYKDFLLYDREQLVE